MMLKMRLLLPLALLFSVSIASEPVKSKHHAGPHNLEGWTLSWPVPDPGWDPQPRSLVIARHGRIVRKIEGDPFVWTWMFQANGTRVAFESGPMHSWLNCWLLDLATGKKIAHYDCFGDVPDDAPQWVQLLEEGNQAFHD